MADNRIEGNQLPPPPRAKTLMEYAIPNMDGRGRSIVIPPILADNFQLKPALIQLVQQNQFGGHDSEDPYAHIVEFLEICDTVRLNGVTDDAIKLMLFPFSLRDEAKSWLIYLPRGSITTWELLVRKFLSRYFPRWAAKLRSEITSFKQHDGESLSEAWERYSEILRKCPQPYFDFWTQVQSFYNGILPHTRVMVDAAALSYNTLDLEQACEFEMMAHNDYQRQGEQAVVKKGYMEEDTLDALLAHNKILTQQLTNLTKEVETLSVNAVSCPLVVCDFCGGDHGSGDCPGNMFSKSQEQVNYMGNPPRPQNNPYSNAYNPGWRNHPNFSWSNQAQQGRQRPPFSHQGPSHQPPHQGTSSQVTSNEQKPAWEIAIEKLATHTSSFMEETRRGFRNTEASIKNLEHQVGQLSKQISERLQGSFPRNTEVT